MRLTLALVIALANDPVPGTEDDTPNGWIRTGNATLFVELFDAILPTWRWSRE
jgi:hypothetical protein